MKADPNTSPIGRGKNMYDFLTQISYLQLYLSVFNSLPKMYQKKKIFLTLSLNSKIQKKVFSYKAMHWIFKNKNPKERNQK